MTENKVEEEVSSSFSFCQNLKLGFQIPFWHLIPMHFFLRFLKENAAVFANFYTVFFAKDTDKGSNCESRV